MGQTLTNADAALKEFYLPPAREQLNNDIKFLTTIEKNSKDIEGRRAVLSLHITRNSGVGARAEGGTLPTAGSQGYTEERVGLRYNYARIQLSGQVIKAMKSDNGSFVRAVDSETQGAVRDLKRDVNRQLFGTSDGVIAATGVTTASVTVVLAAAATNVQVNQLEAGMKVDVGTAGSPASVVTAAVVVSVDKTASPKTVTIDSAITTTTAHRISRTGSGGATTAQKELTGLQTIVASSGALFNVDPATVPSWASSVLSNSGTNRTPSENLFEQAIMDNQVASGSEIELFITSPGVSRAYSNQLTSIKRFNDTQDMKGGYKSIAIDAAGVSGVGITWDRDAPANKAFGLDLSALKQHEMSDWEWMDDDGAILSRVSGADAYEAVLFKYHELTTDQRNAHTLVSDLLEA